MAIQIDTQKSIKQLQTLLEKRLKEEAAKKKQDTEDQEYNMGILEKNLRAIKAEQMMKLLNGGYVKDALTKGFRKDNGNYRHNHFTSCKIKSLINQLKLETRTNLNLQPSHEIIIALTEDTDSKI